MAGKPTAESATENITSHWIQFFSDAGIPASEAANYAIVFTDNRIQKDMLMDLNKEYLNDMGIKMMGDIIAILKHAKLVHSQEQRDKVLNLKTKGTERTSTPPPKRSTPASRFIDHYIGKDANASPLNEPIGSKLSKDLASRLGPTPDDIRPSPETAVKRRHKRTILPDDAGATVSIQSPETSSSVFSRLGEETSFTVTGVTLSPGQPSVFNRLGKPAATSSTSVSDTLKYAGVLKQDDSPSPPKKPKIIRDLKFKVVVPTSSKKILSAGCLAMDSKGTPTKVKDRLGTGKVIASATSTTCITAVKNTKKFTDKSSENKDTNVKITVKSQKMEVSSSSDQKLSVFDRLGSQT